MLIGLVSDSHIGYSYDRARLPDWVAHALTDCDLILHAGDIEHDSFLHVLESLAPVYAVRGNCDRAHIHLPTWRSIHTSGGLITMAHRLEEARREARSNSMVLVYGHTHLPVARYEKDANLLVVNPGSITLPRGGHDPSLALLQYDEREWRVTFKNPGRPVDD